MDEILFAQGVITVTSADDGGFEGTLDLGKGVVTKLRGAISFSLPYSVRFQGIGDVGSDGKLVYDYLGYYVPKWPNGVDQGACHSRLCNPH